MGRLVDNILSRNKHLAEKVVFVDGLPGCGKTMVSQLISGLDRVELLSYAQDVEHICHLRFLGKISEDAAKTMIRMQTDIKLYNTMMGRDVNFRRTDLSSVYRNHNPGLYFERLFGPGDAEVPELIKRQKPILNIATHNMLGISTPIFQALNDRCLFIEVVRHPLYMIRQLALNFVNLDNDVRNFSLHYEYNKSEVPFYTLGWEETFLAATPVGKAVAYMENCGLRNQLKRKELNKEGSVKIITIPFERLVLDPEPWVSLIAEGIGSRISEVTLKIMQEQNVPRQRVAAGIDLEIYRRCGWVPPKTGASERDELDLRRQDVLNEEGDEVARALDKLSSNYESVYWNPDS